jgi:hypothetical protein
VDFVGYFVVEIVVHFESFAVVDLDIVLSVTVNNY